MNKKTTQQPASDTDPPRLRVANIIITAITLLILVSLTALVWGYISTGTSAWSTSWHPSPKVPSLHALE